MNKSIPTSTQVEFVNVSPLNPLISRCEIKVLYTGLNRNKSFITKDTANKMAESLPGTPIVGEYLVEDYGDHGEEDLVIDDNGIRFVKSTAPYGFIPTNAKIWWQNFLDNDGVEREYLLTEGYLWTGRYPECTRVVEKGNGQSMELDRDSLIGEWTKNENAEFEYFNISEAYFSALCILGEEVEPCFEGANIKKPQMLYSLDKDDFKSQLSSFMLDLKDALSIEGGNEVENLDKNLENQEPVGTEPETNHTTEPEQNEEDFAKKKKKDEEEDNSDDTKDKSDDTKDKDKSDDTEDDSDDEDEDKKKKKKKGSFKKDDEDKEDEEEEDDKKKKDCKKYNLEEVSEYVELSKNYLALQTKFEKLQADFDAIQPVLAQFEAEKSERENQAKTEMFNQFYMLEEEDVKEIKENMANFSLEEIESKLCVIAVRKKVNFSLDNTEKNDKDIEKPVTTFDLNGATADSTPAWLKAVDRRINRK